MGKTRILAALVVALGGLSGPGSTAGAEAPGTTDVSVAVPMTCIGPTTETRTITVSATLPSRVRAGRAYTVTDLTTDVPNGGAASITTSAGTPTELAAGSGGSSTLQLVAGAKAGGTITLQVTGASYLLPGRILPDKPFVVPGVGISCTPSVPVTLGRIKVVGRGSGPGADTASIDAWLGAETRFGGIPLQSGPARVTATVPTELHPGDTFTLPDLRTEVPFVPSAVEAVVVPAGTDQPVATPTSVQTVTAQPGETVDLYVTRFDWAIGTIITSTPIGSGHLASIPVVAG